MQWLHAIVQDGASDDIPPSLRLSEDDLASLTLREDSTSFSDSEVIDYVSVVAMSPRLRRLVRLAPWPRAKHLCKLLQWVCLLCVVSLIVLCTQALNLQVLNQLSQPTLVIDAYWKPRRAKVIKLFQDLFNESPSPPPYPQYMFCNGISYWSPSRAEPGSHNDDNDDSDASGEEDMEEDDQSSSALAGTEAEVVRGTFTPPNGEEVPIAIRRPLTKVPVGDTLGAKMVREKVIRSIAFVMQPKPHPHYLAISPFDHPSMANQASKHCSFPRPP